MGHRFATLSGRAMAALVLGIALVLAPAIAAGATDDPPSGDASEGTLLPPEGGVSIVPTDQVPDEPVAPRISDGTEGSSGGLDLDGMGPLEALAWALAAVAALAATGIGITRLTRMLYVWRSPALLAASGFGPVNGHTTTSFSLLVPAGGHHTDFEATLDGLAALDHPSYEVVAVVAYDDLANRSAASRAEARHPGRVQVFVDRNLRRGRAASLNAVIDECRGDVIGVFEPGDQVHPRLLRHVDACLADPAVGAVQGGVRHAVASRRWFAARSVVDQYFWSRSRLQFHARQHFMPLDSTSSFVRAQVLRDVGGWDERCIDEASELGVRLSVQGIPVTAAYDPELATRAAAPTTLRSLLRLHRRRIRGYLQVLRKGVWRRLPTRRQRLLARAMLARPLLEAVTTLAVLSALVGVLVAGAPTAAVVLAVLPALPVPVVVGAELAGLAELGRLEGRRVRARDRLRLVVSFLPYDLLVSVAALAALAGEVRGTDVRQPSVPVAPARDRRSRLDFDDSPPDDDETPASTAAADIVDLFHRRSGADAAERRQLRAAGARRR